MSGEPRMFNCWSVREIRFVLDAERKRRWVTARCRKCKHEVDERLDHFNKRTNCPNCEEAPCRDKRR